MASWFESQVLSDIIYSALNRFSEENILMRPGFLSTEAPCKYSVCPGISIKLPMTPTLQGTFYIEYYLEHRVAWMD